MTATVYELTGNVGGSMNSKFKTVDLINDSFEHPVFRETCFIYVSVKTLTNVDVSPTKPVRTRLVIS